MKPLAYTCSVASMAIVAGAMGSIDLLTLYNLAPSLVLAVITPKIERLHAAAAGVLLLIATGASYGWLYTKRGGDPLDALWYFVLPIFMLHVIPLGMGVGQLIKTRD